MAIPTRIIKRRIKSVRSTRKIMKAMEMVAASKMRKSTQLAIGTRPYSNLIQEVIDRVKDKIDPGQHAMLMGVATEKQKNVTLLLIAASDRGLCGGFNAQLIKKTLEFLKTRSQDEIRIATIGRRAEQAVKRAGYPIVASFEAISNAPSFERAYPIGNFAYEEFKAGNVNKIFIAYTHFKSALAQIPTIKQLLPVMENTEYGIQNTDLDSASDEFEPSASAVLDSLLPRAFEMTVYQSFLESAASEHSARMMAMKSAGDAASEMLDDLTFILNQARQAAITREISEISAGKAAVE